MSSFDLESRYFERYLENKNNKSSGKFDIYINSLNGITPVVGLGFVIVPYCFYQTGFVYGFMAMLMVTLFNMYSLYLLFKLKIITNLGSYHEIGNAAFGRNSVFVVSGANSLFGIGMSLGYFIVIADIISPLLQNMFEADQGSDDYRFYAVLLISASLALFGIKKKSYESEVATVITIVCILIFGLVLWISNIDILSQQEKSISEIETPEISFYSYFKVAPLILSAFGFQPNVLSSHRTFLVEKQGSLWKIISTIYAGSPICYLLVVTFTLSLFGAELQPNLLLTMINDESSSLNYLGAFIFVVIAFIQTPMMFHVGKDSLITIYCEAKYRTFTKQNKVVETDDNDSDIQFSVSKYSLMNMEILNIIDSKEYYMLISLVYVFLIIFSLLITDLQTVLTVLGLFAACPVGFILPALFYLKLNGDKMSVSAKVPAIFLILFGVSQIYSLFSN